MEIVKVLQLMLQILLFVMREFVCSSASVVDHHLVGCLELDREALLDFKSGLEDPNNRLISWKGNNCCQWWGISCDNRTGAVIAIDFQDYGWSGNIRPSLMKLKSLRHLDLSFGSFDDIPIPEFVGSLKNLQYLKISGAFSGLIPLSIGNLSSLQYLGFGYSSGLAVHNLEWVTGLVSLKHLEFYGVNLSMVGLDWIRILSRLPSLTELHMSSCSLSGPLPSHTFLNFTSLAVIDLRANSFHSKIPDSLVNVSSLVDLDMSYCWLYGRIPLGLAELPSLKFLSLSGNDNLTASCSQFFRGKWEKIQVLSLSENKLHGKLPSSIGNMTFLSDFDLSFNHVEGGIPSSIGKLCNLTSFDMSFNNLDGTLPELLEGTQNCLSSLKVLDLSNNRLVGRLPEWLGQLKSIVTLSLEKNSIYGPIPARLGSLQTLVHLQLRLNNLNGTLPNSLGQLSELSTFRISSNHLTGLITDTHFQKLVNLTNLDLSFNSFTLNFSSNWNPPFQLEYLQMGSCHLGTSFPSWLKSQKNLQSLDFSNASISGSIPPWFWNISNQISSLNFSSNNLEGHLPSLLYIGDNSDVDFSSNLFEGPLPSMWNSIDLLDLSNNKFFGPIPEGMMNSDLTYLFLSGNRINGEIPDSVIDYDLSWFRVIDLSNNGLTGSLPSGIGNCTYLRVLDLKKNNLSGKIPESLGQLEFLEILHLGDNKLSGEIPHTFRNLSSVETMDLENNRLTGKIPQWIGEGFESLRILNLRTNSFFGELPSSLSNLSSLQVLDLTGNQLSGSIPASFGDFKAMTQVQSQIKNYDADLGLSGRYYKDTLVVRMKGQVLTFTKTLSLVVSMDLSGNNLRGQLPVEITKLLGLVVLNLSRNHISGPIPESISKLKQLSSLDLSSNKLSGPIPQSLSELSFLGHLNLSNNNFSGMIPYTGHTTTFEEPSFAGNPGLCGPPLDVKCPGGDNDFKNVTSSDDVSSESFIDNWFYLSVGLGFAAGLLVPFLIMAIRKSWSDAYFGIVDKVEERISFFVYKIAIYNRSRGDTRRSRR
ncbi:hypothetical protein UlMin_007115 [Ulmus minor]